MKLSLVQLSAFAREWKRLELTDEDLQSLEMAIMASPDGPPIVAGTGGLRKIRFAGGPGSGKSGGVRVCYAYFSGFGLVYLCAVFAKSDKANLTVAERNAYRKVIEQFDAYLRKWFKQGWTP